MSIVQVALPLAAWSSFDYWAPEGLCIAAGTIVRVPLARRLLHGVVLASMSTSEVPADRLQAILEVVDGVPALPADVMELAAFVSRYYQQPPGLVLGQMLPPLERDAVAVPREPPPAAWGLTAHGRELLSRRAARLSPAAQELLVGLMGAPQLPREAFDALPPMLRATIRRWRTQGLVATVDAPDRGADQSAAQRPALNAEQRAALDAIEATRGFAPTLLQGVTGSGKTEVYLAAAAGVIGRGGQVLLLVPEINLTPQLEQRVRAALPTRHVVTLHSRLSAGERRSRFCAAASGAADLVVGTRLAVFTPLPRLGLVIVDEEHDASFKQQDNVRYHGRDVAIWRARQRDVPIVLGSATPALETLLRARTGRYRHLRLAARAVALARMPQIVFAPARLPDASDGLGPALLEGIARRLQRGEQTLVFINRRGFAPSLLCAACGWRAECTQCSARLVVHREANALRCHHCGHSQRLYRACPTCGNVDLLPMGHGTQRLEEALRARFPAARIARVDRDTTQRKGAFASVRERIHAGEIDVLIGTQMLAKSHDFPGLTLVGVLGADNALYSADFRATERLGSLLFQVAGRAGRAELPGEVIVQTDFPDHPLYQALARHDYDRLADALLAERRVTELPPYTHLALLAAEAPERETVDAFLARASTAGRAEARAQALPIEVFSPVSAALARRAGMERAQVVVQSAERGALQRFLPAWRMAVEAIPSHRIRWALDVDPLTLG